VLYRSIANPESGSDFLWILAEALRDGADKSLMALADEIAALAPTRATPLPPPPTTVHATMAATLAEVHHHMARTEVAGIVPGHNPT
jgi:hypothetical protein